MLVRIWNCEGIEYWERYDVMFFILMGLLYEVKCYV